MFNVPVTFLFDYTTDINRNARRMIFREFVENGAPNLVLTDIAIKEILSNFNYSAELRKDAEECGITFVDAHAPFGRLLDLNCPDPAYRRQMINRHKVSLNICQEMGVDTITIHVGNDWDEDMRSMPLQKHLDNISEALDAILPEAERCGVTVCIENIWFRTNTPERLLEFKAKFPTDNLGFCYDAGHANLMYNGQFRQEAFARDSFAIYGEATPWDNRILEKMLPHVVNCHLHDNDGATDQHRLPGCGCIDWKHIIPLLKQAPRLKSVQSEVIPSCDPNFSIRKVADIFRGLAE
ncbi:MAG: sugar phosphate isomerase/epimerase [Victivallales bacterium]|nr:sugar phosphate isomerase/epimerase [Victivallales bacterium]